jgi:hypothetical protein
MPWVGRFAAYRHSFIRFAETPHSLQSSRIEPERNRVLDFLRVEKASLERRTRIYRMDL